MICQRCLHRASALRLSRSVTLSRSIISTAPPASPIPPSSTSSTPLSTPLDPNPKNPGHTRPKSKAHSLPVSYSPAGSELKGLNYLKGRDDPIALPEVDYPEWLWHCLDVKAKGDDIDSAVGDEFSKSKKQRRTAAKLQRKREAKLLASGDLDALAPKIPLQQQTIDLPFNEEGTLAGAVEAATKRDELRKAMRAERRAKIKEANYLLGV